MCWIPMGCFLPESWAFGMKVFHRCVNSFPQIPIVQYMRMDGLQKYEEKFHEPHN